MAILGLKYQNVKYFSHNTFSENVFYNVYVLVR